VRAAERRESIEGAGDPLAEVSEQTSGEIEAIAGDVERIIAEKDAEIEAKGQQLAEAEAKIADAQKEGEAATIAAIKSRLGIF
jgi:hypothetical protein